MVRLGYMKKSDSDAVRVAIATWTLMHKEREENKTEEKAGVSAYGSIGQW